MVKNVADVHFQIEVGVETGSSQLCVITSQILCLDLRVHPLSPKLTEVGDARRADYAKSLVAPYKCERRTTDKILQNSKFWS